MAGSNAAKDRLTSHRNGFLGTSPDGRQEAGLTGQVGHPHNAAPKPPNESQLRGWVEDVSFSDAEFLASIGVRDAD
jgi:hypothetical protein